MLIPIKDNINKIWNDPICAPKVGHREACDEAICGIELYMDSNLNHGWSYFE